MKPKDQRTPNLLLRRQRLLRGWSLQRVVNEICALSEQDGRIPGVSAAMVSCWEMGKKKPSPFYQERLCSIYDMAADQLGFVDELTMPHANYSGEVSAIHSSSKQVQAIDLLTGSTEHTPDEQLGAWLTLGAHHLSMLLDAGWSPENVMDSLRVVLQGVQGLPASTRRKLLQLSGTASIIGITLPTGTIYQRERKYRLPQKLVTA